MSTTISGDLAQLFRSRTERIALLDWAFSKAARIVAFRRSRSKAFDPAEAFAVVADDQAGPAYNEEAFRYFLRLEAKRAERAASASFLMLIHTRERVFAPMIAARIFGVLQHCLRDTDFTGWYRHGEVVGAVLTQVDAAADGEISSLVVQRVTDALANALPRSSAARLELRIRRVTGASDGQY